MDLEPSDHEPEEVDPESDLYDPTTDSLTIPQVETDASDADPKLVTMFWALVLVVKASILTTSLGILLLAFDVMPQFGLAALAAGVVLAGFAVYRYRTFDPSAVSSDDDGVSEDSGADAHAGRPSDETTTEGSANSTAEDQP
ncbi:CAAX protease family protein [Saliphagus sp. GCM10025308]|uniref:CAAX protease family protein n=1 Tax=Natronosalvus rutilus TaxID=2953753 RepID=A0A9E7NB45_9EURY|nr:CAAX protease family protein [Natronosalvus rutilus]UTF53708.1 CAAX protease family protein [Natronosalvus rutilus]